MKKSLLIILLVIFSFTLWTVYAFGKATKTEKPTQVQKTEQVEPQFPKVAPAPTQVWEPVRKGTIEDFQKAVQTKKGRTPVQIQQMQEQPVHVPDAVNATEAMPNYCVVQNLDIPTCCYYQSAGSPYLSCWGIVRFLTLLDIDNNTSTPACNFPYYPFDVDTVRFQLYAGDACSLYVKARVYNSYQADPDCKWLTGPTYYSDSMWVQHVGGFVYIDIPIPGDACVYGPFWAMVYIYNTDDFYQGADPSCSGAPFQFGLSWVFDGSGRQCISYWGSLTYLDGYLYDMVSNGITSGPIRIRAIGHTATDNLCTNPADEWYYKDALDDAPSGMPDFDQWQFPSCFDGPTAGADVMWWQLSNNTGLAMPVDAPTLVNQIAAASGTIPGVGTVCDALEAGLLQVVQSMGGWWFAETTVYAPDFIYLQKYTRQCHTMTLLLGFWQTPDGGTTWYRFGGHFVAVSGVDIFAPTYQVALSDPYMDYAEWGGPGLVYHPVDPWPHVGNPLVHNNSANVSVDWYTVSWPSVSPGGYLYLPDYVPYTVRETTICVPIPPKNHFKTWSILPQTFDSTIFVQDQFMEDSLRLLGIEFFSDPTWKQHETETYEVIDSTHHLVWYKAQGKATEREVIYQNQFESTAITIDSVEYLLVPNQLIIYPPPAGLDHYKAYRIKNPVTLNVNVILKDRIDSLVFGAPESITTLKPVYFLTPAKKNMEPGFDPVTHYVAYEISPKRSTSASLITEDQFGVHSMNIQSSDLLLVPTTKCYTITTLDSAWEDFNGQNAGPFQNDGTYNPQLPVQVEVEQLIDFYQGSKRITGEVDGDGTVDELNNNMGGITGFDILFGASVFSPLFYGSLFSGTSQADLRGDYGDYYPTYSFTPLAPPTVDNWTVNGKAGDYDIMMTTMNFGHADFPGLEYYQYAFGIGVPAGGTAACRQMIEDVYVIQNNGAANITGLEKALFFDYDIGGNAALVDWDQQHASIWMWDLPAPDTVAGLTEVPVVKGVAPITGWGISNGLRIYDGQYVDSMKYYMESDPATGVNGWGTEGDPAGEDMSLLLADGAFDLPIAGLHINKYTKWAYNASIATGGDANWRHFLYNILHQLGYYRGDVNQDGKFDVADVIYTVNFLFKSGPKPVEFVDQGDVNNDGNTNVTDVIFMVNNRFKGGPFPIDKERFYEGAPTIPVAFKGLTVRESLFNDAAWKSLGQ